MFETGDFWSNTIRIRPVASTAEPRTIYTSDKFQADAIFRKDRMYFRTNRDAPNWKLMAASYANPEFADWTTLIPEGATVLDQVAVTRTGIVARDREDVLTRLALYGLDGKRLRDLPPPAFGSMSSLAYDLDADTVYAGLASHTLPPSQYALAGEAFAWKLVWQDDAPLDASTFVSKRVYVPAKDGAKIPVFIVHRKDLKQDGANPTLLVGYGGFNIAVEPYYMGGWYPFISRGGVFVDAGVRGGSEYGETWHEQAMFARKQNTFDDMVAVADWLIAEKYTQPAKLAVEGGSNGGLTVGALLTQRPDLFRAAICQVPLLDMVRYHKFLIARYWIPEYGDPDRAEDFRWILRYSPYQNVRAGREHAGDAGRRRRVRLARRSAAREEVRGGGAEQPRPGVAVPAVHGLRQRPRHRQDDAAAGDRSRLRAAVRDERAGDERRSGACREMTTSARAAQPVLPPRLVDGDGDGVRQVEAAHAGPHRNAQARRRRELRDARPPGRPEVSQPKTSTSPAAKRASYSDASPLVVNANQRRGAGASSAARHAAKSGARERARIRGSRGRRASTRDRPSGSRAARRDAGRWPCWR